jgi:hypothetical protein
MYCPKCAAQNITDAQFCRSCGANISLVPQALTGSLPAASSEIEDVNSSGRRRKNRAPSLDKAVKQMFMGVGFLIVAISIAVFGRQVGGNVWWFWLLIPAFSMLGGGVAELMRYKQGQQSLAPAPFVAAPMPTVSRAKEFPARNTAELAAPPSVTEGTTRHLGSEAATQHFDASIGRSSERK